MATKNCDLIKIVRKLEIGNQIFEVLIQEDINVIMASRNKEVGRARR